MLVSYTHNLFWEQNFIQIQQGTCFAIKKNCHLIIIIFIQLEGGILDLPLLDPSMRATPLAPSEWRKRLEAANGIDDSSNEDINTKFILLDVRNGSLSFFQDTICLCFLSSVCSQSFHVSSCMPVLLRNMYLLCGMVIKGQ